MKIRENYLTVSFGDSLKEFVVISREKTGILYRYFLFDKFKILEKKKDPEKESRREKRKEFNRLNKHKICIDNFYTEDYLNKQKKYLLIMLPKATAIGGGMIKFGQGLQKLSQAGKVKKIC